MFATAMAVAWTVDVPVASYFRLERQPEFFHELVSFAEVFGHGLGVAYILSGCLCVGCPPASSLAPDRGCHCWGRPVGRLGQAGSGTDPPSCDGARSGLGQLCRLVSEVPSRDSARLERQRLPIDSLGARGGCHGSGNWTLPSLSTWPMAFCMFCGSGLVAAHRNVAHTTSAIRWPVRPSHAWSGPPVFDRRGLGRWFDRWEAKQAEANVAVSSLGRYDTETGVEERIERGSCP